MLLKLCLTLVIFLISATAFAEIRIGYTSDLSAENQDYDNDLGRGLDTYFRYINSLGGIRGQHITLVAIDNANDLKLFEKSLAKLIAEDIKLIIANPVPIYGSEELISKFLANNNQIIISKNLQFQERPKQFLSYKVGYLEEVKSLIDLVLTNKSFKEDSIAIYADDSSFAQECMNAAVNDLVALGAWPERIQTIAQSEMANIQPVVTKLINNKIKGMLLCAKPNNIPKFMAALSPQLPQVLYFTTSQANTLKFINDLDPKYNGLMVAQNVPSYNANLPVAIEYKQLYKKTYNKYKFSSASFEGFILGKIIVAALQASNAMETTGSLLSGFNSFDSVAIGLHIPLIFAATTTQQGIDRVWTSKIVDHDFVSTN